MNPKPALALAAVSMAAAFALTTRAESATITYVFDYYTVPPHAAPHTPVGPAGPFGALTLSDSLVDPNRVDISLSINPLAPWDVGYLDRFYLNFDSDPDDPAVPNDADFLTSHLFRLVAPDTPATGAANTPFTSAQIIGNVSYTKGTTSTNFANFIFDFVGNPEDNKSQTFEASISLYNRSAAPDTPVDLDVSMFDLTSVLTRGQTLPVYAAYRTFDVPKDKCSGLGEFWAFATRKEVPDDNKVPDSGGTFLLLSGSLLGLAALAAGKAKK